MLQPIQTRYQGYEFRSRLEARWAVFFNHIGLRWEYEPEGFDLGNGVYYLPDFRVTSPQGLVSWYEVKPLSNPDNGKLKLFSKLLGLQRIDGLNAGLGLDKPVGCELLVGDPVEHLTRKLFRTGRILNSLCPRCGQIQETWPYQDQAEVYYDCFPCDMDTPSGGDNPWEDGVAGEVRPHKGTLIIRSWDWHYWCRTTIAGAAIAARSARFEFGQSGASRKRKPSLADWDMPDLNFYQSKEN